MNSEVFKLVEEENERTNIDAATKNSKELIKIEKIYSLRQIYKM